MSSENSSGDKTNFDRMKLSIELGTVSDYLKWGQEIPYIQYPAHWYVKPVPPFMGAIVRFYVQTSDHEGETWEDHRVSVYLDCYETLGCFGGPYWEIYPGKDGEPARVAMSDIPGLIDAIESGLTFRKNSRNGQ